MRKYILNLFFVFIIFLLLCFIIDSPWPLYIYLMLMVVGLAVFLMIGPKRVEKSMNKIVDEPPYQVSDEARQLHEKLFVVDLHADPLLWKRDLNKRYDYGHIDVPRLLEGNVAFQSYGVVTKSPQGQNFEGNAADAPDNISLLARLQLWPHPAWDSLYERALYQALKLQKFSMNSNGKLVMIKTKTDLENFLEARKKNPQMTAGFPMLEGCHALEGKLENLDNLYDAGYRMIGLTHFFDNEIGGSAHGEKKYGLTPLGFKVVKRIFELNMILDLAHSSPAIIDDVLKMADRPVIASHTGVRGTNDSPRNLSDKHIRGIAKTGGVMGIAWFDEAVGEPTFEAVVRATKYVADLVGVDHVAVGGDLDGTVTSPTDITGMPLLTEALLKAGFSEEEIAKIMGLNALRVFRELLPD